MHNVNATMILFLTISFVFGACTHDYSTGLFRKDRITINQLEGVWRLDSSRDYRTWNDKLFILKDSSYYRFSGSDGGSLRESGKFFSRDSLRSKWGDERKIELLNANRLRVAGGWNKMDDYFHRLDFRSVDDLDLFLKRDSLRAQVIGWWQVTHSQFPIDLPNSNGNFLTFTLNIREDGRAVFYLDNLLDSTATYDYSIEEDAIELASGCVVASHYMELQNDSTLLLQINRYFPDTLILKRVEKMRTISR